MPAIGILYNSFAGRGNDGRPRLHTVLLGEPSRCIHIGDRESDLYELFCAARESGTKFLVRTCADRLADDGRHTIAAPPRGREKIDWKLIANLPLRSRINLIAAFCILSWRIFWMTMLNRVARARPRWLR